MLGRGNRKEDKMRVKRKECRGEERRGEEK
jgi:hypothetical protein